MASCEDCKVVIQMLSENRIIRVEYPTRPNEPMKYYFGSSKGAKEEFTTFCDADSVCIYWVKDYYSHSHFLNKCDEARELFHRKVIEAL